MGKCLENFPSFVFHKIYFYVTHLISTIKLSHLYYLMEKYPYAIFFVSFLSYSWAEIISSISFSLLLTSLILNIIIKDICLCIFQPCMHTLTYIYAHMLVLRYITLLLMASGMEWAVNGKLIGIVSVGWRDADIMSWVAGWLAWVNWVLFII